MNLEDMLSIAYEAHGKEITPNVIKLWLLIMQGQNITDQQAVQALQTIVATSKYLPKPADVVELVNGNQRDLLHNAATKGKEELRRELLRVGGKIGAQPQFDDPKVAICVKRMGWDELCHISEQDFNGGTFNAQWRDMYMAIPDSDVTEHKALTSVASLAARKQIQGAVE